MNNSFTPISTHLNKEIQCEYFPVCSGCKKQKNLEEHPKQKKLEKRFNRSIPFYVEAVIHWRHKVKLAVGGSSFSPQIGLFKENTHQIISIPKCPLHTPAINEAIAVISEAIQKTGMLPYHEETQTGVLRYIQIIEERESKQLSLTFVVASSLNEVAQHPFFEFVKNHLEGRLVSFWLNEKTGRDNVIFGKKWLLLAFQARHQQRLLDRVFYFHPASFCQVHLHLFEKVLKRIQEWTPNGAVVLELYAGVGIIGQIIGSKVKSVDCYENNLQAEACFHLAMEREPLSNIEFFCKGAETFDPKKPYSLVIVDPPRKGMHQEVQEKLLSIETLETAIFLYCDTESFILDSEKWIQAGFEVVSIETYLFFPGSEHIEILAKLEKKSE